MSKTEVSAEVFRKGQSYLAQRIVQKNARIKSLEADLARAIKAVPHPDGTAEKPARIEMKNGDYALGIRAKSEKPALIANCKEKVAEVNQDLEALKKLEALYPPIVLKSSLEIGQVGPVISEKDDNHPASVSVLQIIDANNAILEARFFSQTFTAVNNVPRVVNRTSESQFWLNAPTAGMVDGNGFLFEGLYEVSGTKTYETQSGSNTIHILKPYKPKK